MKGEVIKKNNENFGVTSIIMVSKDKEKIKKLFLELCEQDPNSFYMIYNINLDEKLDEKLHYPSIAISLPEDCAVLGADDSAALNAGMVADPFVRRIQYFGQFLIGYRPFGQRVPKCSHVHAFTFFPLGVPASPGLSPSAQAPSTRHGRTG